MITDLLNKQDEKEPPFPYEAFPSCIGRYGKVVAESVNCPPDFVFAAILCALSIATGSKNRIQIKQGWTEGAVLFMVIVGNPGTRKTPAINKGLYPIMLLQKKFGIEPPKKEDDEAAEPEFQPKTILTTDFTLEALVEILHNNPHGVLISMDEIMGLMKGFNQYKSGGNDMEKFLSLFSQTVIVVARKKKPTVQINNPFVILIGGIQEEILDSLSVMKGNGFVDRLLFVYPKSIPAKHTEVEIPDELSKEYAKIVTEIYDFFNDQDLPEEIVWSFSPEAKALWNSWHTTFCEDMNASDIPYYVKGSLTKLEAYTARFALILEFTWFTSGEGGALEHISERSLKGAIKLTEYFKWQALKVYSSFTASSQDKQIEKGIAWFMKQPNGKATLRRVYTNKVGGAKNFSEAYDLLCEMRSRGLGKLEEYNEGTRKMYNFILNPTLFRKPTENR